MAESLAAAAKAGVVSLNRSSFAYRPLEVVGIALGLSSCKHRDDQQVEWLKGALGELSKLSGGSFWESTLYQFAGDILGIQNKVNAPRQWAGLLSRELALARWIGSVSESFVSFADQNFAPLDEAFSSSDQLGIGV